MRVPMFFLRQNYQPVRVPIVCEWVLLVRLQVPGYMSYRILPQFGYFSVHSLSLMVSHLHQLLVLPNMYKYPMFAAMLDSISFNLRAM